MTKSGFCTYIRYSNTTKNNKVVAIHQIFLRNSSNIFFHCHFDSWQSTHVCLEMIVSSKFISYVHLKIKKKIRKNLQKKIQKNFSVLFSVKFSVNFSVLFSVFFFNIQIQSSCSLLIAIYFNIWAISCSNIEKIEDGYSLSQIKNHI